MILGWYEAIKDGIAVAQQVDNIPLVEKLIDAQMQILDLVNENQQLREQIKEMQASDTMMPISRYLMILISVFIVHVAGTRKECWYKGKRLVWVHIAVHPAEQMRTTTKRLVTSTSKRPLKKSTDSCDVISHN